MAILLIFQEKSSLRHWYLNLSFLDQPSRVITITPRETIVIYSTYNFMTSLGSQSPFLSIDSYTSLQVPFFQYFPNSLLPTHSFPFLPYFLRQSPHRYLFKQYFTAQAYRFNNVVLLFSIIQMYIFQIIVIFINKYITVSLADLSACLTTNQEFVGSIPGISTIV